MIGKRDALYQGYVTFHNKENEVIDKEDDAASVPGQALSMAVISLAHASSDNELYTKAYEALSAALAVRVLKLRWPR